MSRICHLTLYVGSALTTVPSFEACILSFFFFQAEDGIRDIGVTGVQTCALPIFLATREPLRQLGAVHEPHPRGLGQLEGLPGELARGDKPRLVGGVMDPPGEQRVDGTVPHRRLPAFELYRHPAARRLEQEVDVVEARLWGGPYRVAELAQQPAHLGLELRDAHALEHGSAARRFPPEGRSPHPYAPGRVGRGGVHPDLARHRTLDRKSTR